MTKKSIIFFSGIVAAAMVILAAGPLSAQVTMQLNDEADVVVKPGKWYEYHITVKNMGLATETFHVVRSTNNLPDENWFSTICMEDFCYQAAESRTNSYELGVGEEHKIKFTVYAGNVPETEGHFVLKVITEGFGGGEAGQVEMSVTASDASSVPVIAEPTLLPYPNPTISDLTIPLRAVADAESVEIYSITGAVVRSFEGSDVTGESLRINTADLAPGVYHYRISGSTEARVGTFQVVR